MLYKDVIKMVGDKAINKINVRNKTKYEFPNIIVFRQTVGLRWIQRGGGSRKKDK